LKSLTIVVPNEEKTENFGVFIAEKHIGVGGV